MHTPKLVWIVTDTIKTYLKLRKVSKSIFDLVNCNWTVHIVFIFLSHEINTNKYFK